MAAVLTEPLGNPTGQPSGRPSGPAVCWRRPATRWPTSSGRDRRRDRLHLGGTESANLAVLGRRGGPAAPDRRRPSSCSSAVEHPAVRESCRARGSRSARTRRSSRSTAAGVLDLDALVRALSSRITLVAVMTANNETGVMQPVRRGGRGRCTGARRTPCLHRRRAGGALPGPGATRRRSRPGVAQRAQARRSGRRRARWPCVPACRTWRHASTGAARSASAAAGPRTWWVRSAWPPRCGRPRPSERRRRQSGGRRRDRLATGCSTRCRRRNARVPAGVDVLPGHLHLCIAGVEREELLVALGARGRVCLGRVVVRQRRARAQSSARRHGRAGRPGRGRHPLHPGPRTTDEDIERALPDRPGRRRRAASWGLSHGWHTGTMRVLVAMSGGVDSSVAAALLVEQGHEVVGATLKLWGGQSDSGCCSVADVDDARRVAQQLGIAHHVFNLTEEFDRAVVAPYVEEHAAGAHAEPVHRVQPHHEVRSAAGPVRAPRLRPPGHRAPRPGEWRGRATPAAGCRRGQGPVLRPLHVGPGRRWPGWSSRSGT